MTASKPKTSAVLAIILVSYFMILLDNSIIFTGLPRIQDDLVLSTTSLSWVQNAYTLTFGGLLLLGARAGDVLGRRRMLVVGLAVFAAASLAIGAAPTAGWMLAARAVQGVGAAILAPSTLALLTASFAEGPERTRAVSAYGAVAGIGASVGLVVGGVLADVLSWRVGFLVNVPIGIAMIVAARRHLPETPRSPGRFDVLGAVASTLGMTSLVYGIVRAGEAGWRDVWTVGAITAGVLLLVLFVIDQRRTAQPIMPLRLFASRERTGAYLARMLFLGAMVGFFFFTTQLLQGVHGYSPLQAGLGFLPMTAVNFAVALCVPRLTVRCGNAALLATGLALTTLGMAWLSRVGVDSAYLTSVAFPMVLVGVGQGLAFGPLTASGVAGVDAKDAGAASGLVNAAHQLGGALGLGVLVAVAASAGGDSGDPRVDLAGRVAAAYSTGSVFLVLALVAVLVLVVRRPRVTAIAAADHAQAVPAAAE